MLKKFLLLILIIFTFLYNIQNAYAITINSESALLFDLNSGTTMFSYNSKAKMYPASITKIMTAIIALELGNLDDIITVDDETPYEIYGSMIALEPGEILSLKDLLYALILPSANDAASVIAKHYSGTINKFVDLMNSKAVELGATNTHFSNPHGLHDDNHYTTAEDLKKITIHAMKNETFRDIVKTKQYVIPATNKKEERIINTTNNLLVSTASQIIVDNKYVSREYEGALGIKTGFTYEANNCLISYAQKNGLDLVAIVLKGSGQNVYTDTHNLLNYGFENFKSSNIIKKNVYVQDLIINTDTKKLSIPLVTKDAVNILANDINLEKITNRTEIYGISAPIKKGETVGRIEYLLDDEIIGSTELISTKTVNGIIINKDTQVSTIDSSKKYSFFPWLQILLALVIGIFILRIINLRKKAILRKKRIKRRAEYYKRNQNNNY